VPLLKDDNQLEKIVFFATGLQKTFEGVVQQPVIPLGFVGNVVTQQSVVKSLSEGDEVFDGSC
jgi:hypothetical protein